MLCSNVCIHLSTVQRIMLNKSSNEHGGKQTNNTIHTTQMHSFWQPNNEHNIYSLVEVTAPRRRDNSLCLWCQGQKCKVWYLQEKMRKIKVSFRILQYETGKCAFGESVLWIMNCDVMEINTKSHIHIIDTKSQPKVVVNKTSQILYLLHVHAYF